MRAIIVEDELASSRRLERMLSSLNIEVITCFISVSSSVNWLKNNNHPDLLFLDIQLSDSLSFDIFNVVNIKCPIIFTTAYSEYSIKAFDYNSIAYLLKPIQELALNKAIGKAQFFYDSANQIETLKKVISEKKLTAYKNKFTVKSGNRIKIISTDDIECFYSTNNITFIYSNSISYCVNHSLNEIEQQIDNTSFFRVNRSFILNINNIKSISSFSNNRLKLTLQSFSDSEIIVSRTRVKDFKKWIS